MTTSTFKFSAVLSGMLVAASLMTAGISFAQATKGVGATIEGGPGMRPTASTDQRINRLDKNKDGQISREEATGHPKLAKAFNRIDVNKDEQLSRDELRAFHEKRQANRAAHGKPVKEPKVKTNATAPAAK